MKLLTTLIFILMISFTAFSQRFSVDSSLAPVINGAVTNMQILSDGKILISGEFTSVNGVARSCIARLNSDGSLDTSFNANWIVSIFNDVSITAMKALPDGKVLIGGRLPYGNSIGRPRVLRLLPTGALDNTLTSNPSVSDENLYQEYKKIDQLPNGKILVCGVFGLSDDSSRRNLARYNADGTYDFTFPTTINNECQDIEVLPDGKYYVSGYYTTINGNPSESLVRFNQDGTIDTSFNAAPIPNTVEHTYYYRIKLQSDGKILAFRSAECCARIKAARLNSDGSIHTNFATNLDAFWGDFAVQPDGKVIIVSTPHDVPGQTVEVNRFNTDGTHDPSMNRFGFGGSYSGAYSRIAEIMPDGKLIVGGKFSNININNTNVSQRGLMRLSPQAIPIRPKYDFDGDGKSDIALYRPSTGIWYVSKSTGGFSATQFGISTDKPVSADYDGDGKSDIAVFRDGVWYWLRSSDSVFSYQTCGQPGDIPTPRYGNFYGGNSNADNPMIFRPSSTPKFYTQSPYYPAQVAEFRNVTLSPTDKPVIADYDGDGRDDLAVYRDGNWFVMKSGSASLLHYQFGTAGDKAVVGDFDGDLRTDYAVYRPSNGSWYIYKSTEGFYSIQWGLADDLPVPADYDGDGKVDIAVYRPSNGSWYIIKSTGGYHFEQFGLAGDIPAQLRQ